MQVAAVAVGRSVRSDAHGMDKDDKDALQVFLLLCVGGLLIH